MIFRVLAISVPSYSKALQSNRTVCLPGLLRKYSGSNAFVAANKTFCVYLAESEALVFEHAKLGGFSVTKVTEVPTVISPMTAY